LSRLENSALQDGPFSWDYTTQISVFDWGGRVGGKLDFIDSPRTTAWMQEVEQCRSDCRDTKDMKFLLKPLWKCV